MNEVAANTPNIPNVITFDQLTETAKQLGSECGKGKDTQVKFLLKIVEGAYHGAIDNTANKHGTDIDDVVKLAETYVLSQRTATVFDAKAANQRKLVSCLRSCVRLGQWPKGGNGEPLQTVNNLITTRQKLRQLPNEAKKLDDAANTLLKYARQQVKRDQLMNDSELRALCYKPDHEARDAEAILESCRNQLDKLIAGKASKGQAMDADPLVKSARKSLTDRLVQIAKAKGKAGGAQPQA